MMRNDYNGDQENQPRNQASVMFDHILNELGGVGKEDNSKMGTLAGNALDFKAKLQSDFNAPLFENFEPLDEEPYQASSDESEERKEEGPPSSEDGNQSPSDLDDSDYDEMDF